MFRTLVSLTLPLCLVVPTLVSADASIRADARIALANPAATHCVEGGGKYEIRESSDGAVGICILADGTEVDAWEHFRSQAANPAAVHCVDTGGHYEMQKTDAGVQGICVLSDGTRVDAWEYFRAQKS